MIDIYLSGRKKIFYDTIIFKHLKITFKFLKIHEQNIRKHKTIESDYGI